MARKQVIWLAFDLGVRGDYQNLYTWLDENNAKECGEGVAFLEYKHIGDDLADKLKDEIENRVQIDKRSRLYVIYRHPTTKLNKGTFIFGSRKAPAWTGFASSDNSDDEELYA